MEIISWWNKCMWEDFPTTRAWPPMVVWTVVSVRGDALRGVLPALRHGLAVKNRWKSFDFIVRPKSQPLSIQSETVIPANLHTDLTFLSSRNEAGNIASLYLSNIALLFSHTASSLFMLRVVFVPFDSYSQGSLSFESVSCFRAAFFPPQICLLIHPRWDLLVNVMGRLLKIKYSSGNQP